MDHKSFFWEKTIMVSLLSKSLCSASQRSLILADSCSYSLQTTHANHTYETSQNRLGMYKIYGIFFPSSIQTHSIRDSQRVRFYGRFLHDQTPFIFYCAIIQGDNYWAPNQSWCKLNNQFKLIRCSNVIRQIFLPCLRGSPRKQTPR